ncbi:phage minor head protein [Laceyella tengchongensis]
MGWYDGLIQRDELRQKNIMETLRLIRDINPDASMAIWNFLRLSNQGHELECIKPSGSPDKPGLEYLKELAQRVGKLYAGGADQLINVLNLSGYTQGAIALEVELNEGLDDVVDFHAIDPASLDFRRNEAGKVELVQRQSDGKLKVLNQEQVFYYPIDPDIADPYGRSPILPVLQIIFFQVEVLRDLKAVAHHQGHARFDISIMEEAILNNIPAGIVAQGEEKVREFILNYIADIERMFTELKPDDHFIHPDSVKVEMTGGTNGKSMDVTKIIDVINQQVVTALKQLPILLGRNEGTTETHGSIQWQIYVAGIESIQRGVKRVLERAYNLALQIQGRQSRARLTFNQLRTTDRLLEAQAEEIETRTKIQQINQGWITNDEAAQEMVGHEAVSEPQVLNSSPAIPGRSRRMQVKRVPKTRKEDEDEFVKEIEATWALDLARLTTKAIKVINDQLRAQVNTYIERLREVESPPTRILLSRDDGSEPSSQFEDWVIAEILYDTSLQVDKWEKLLVEWIEQAAEISGRATLLEFDLDIDFDMREEQLLRWLSNRAYESANLLQKTTDHDIIMELWDVVYEGNYSIDKAEEALRNSFAFSKNRARTIARTEMISAARAGQFYADRQSGIVIGKEWFAAHQPDRTRPWHLEADGQIKRLDEPFEVNGEKLMFPGDTSLGATADNIVNCRCGYFRILEGEQMKRL